MKKIIFAVLLAALLTSCATVAEQAKKETFTSPDQINSWVYYYIEWEDAPDTEDTVSPAEATLARGKGSCYDQCVVFIYLAKRVGIDAKLYPVVTETGYHMCVYCDGYIYDTTNNERYFVLPSGWTEYLVKK